MGKKRLFDEVEHDNDEAAHLSVNEEYAARLMHNKRREELHRLQEKHAALQATQTETLLSKGAAGEDSLSSSSSSSDEDDVDVHEELQDAEFLQTLAWARGKVSDTARNAQPPPELKLAPAGSKRKKHKPILLKDVAAMEGLEEEESASDADQPSRPYAQELEDFRQSLIQAAEASGQESAEGAELFSEPARGAVGQPAAGRRGQRGMQELLDRYFGRDEELGEDDLFLKRFMSQRGVEDDDGGRPAAEWRLEDDQEDEEFMEAAERFEAAHNFRFEEADAGYVKTYPRRVDDVVRQADTKRAEVRARKKQRKQEEKAKLVAEVQRMKTLKRQEVEDSLREIRKYAGPDASDEVLGGLLEAADFDGEQYDMAMEKAFGTDYYQADADNDEEEGILQTEGAESSEGEGTEAAGGFRAMRRQLAAKTGAAARPEDAARVQQLLAEYNQLDYEDIVAGIPTRFSYREVPKETFGLSTADILSLSDKELNQVVGLRKIAPYREERNPRKARFQTMHRLRSLATSAAQPSPSMKSSEPGVNGAEAPLQNLHPSSARLASYARPKAREGPQQRSTALVETPVKAKSAKQTEGGSPAVASALTKVQKRNARRTSLRSLRKESES